MATDSVPAVAEATRHPNGVLPNSFSPAATIHLPTGGCTVMVCSPGASRWHCLYGKPAS